MAYVDFKIGTNKLEQFSIMELTREQYDEIKEAVNSSPPVLGGAGVVNNTNIKSIFDKAQKGIQYYSDKEIINKINK